MGAVVEYVLVVTGRNVLKIYSTWWSFFFFYVGKVFYLRGGKEQVALKQLQFVRSYTPDIYTYAENGSKNRSEANLKESNKVIPACASVDCCSGAWLTSSTSILMSFTPG